MFQLNIFGDPQPLNIYLSKADGELLTMLNDIIVEDSANLSIGLNQQYELSFDIQIDSNNIWLQYIVDGMYLFVEKIGLFKTFDVSTVKDGITDTKSITAQSVDSEFDSIILNFPVNMGLKNSMEYLVTYDEDETETIENPYTGIPYDWIVLYNTFPEQLLILLNNVENRHFGIKNGNGDIVVTDQNLILELMDIFNTIPRLKNKVVYSDNQDGSKDSTLVEYVIIERNENDNETIDSITLTSLFKDRILYLISFYYKYRKQLSLLDIILEKTGYGWRVGKIWGLDKNDFTLANKKYQFDINETAYSFLTQTLAQDIKAVVNFNNIRRLINITPVEEIGEDTGITIGYDNLVNNLNINTAEDILTTRIYVSGDNELSVARVNFGSDIVDDLSYKINARDSNGKRIYVSDEFANRYNEFVDYREGLRDRYIQLSIDFEKYNEQISEIKNRVPLDDLKTDYGTFSMEELEVALTTYKNLLVTLSSLYKEDYGEAGLNSDGSIKESYIKTTEYWYDYEAYVYTIKEIEFAIKVFPYYKDHTQWSSGDSDLYKSEIRAWETEWTLYGTIELDAKIKDYHNRMDTLAQKGVIRKNATGYEIKSWAELSPDEKREYSGLENNYKYNEYMEYYNYANEAQPYLDSLNAEIKSLETLRDNANSERLQIAEDVTVDNYFSDNDLKIIYRLYHDATYSNQNILVTSIDNVEDRISHMKELLEDAKDQISIISRPQLTFSVDCENLLAMPEFKPFWDKFVPGNYIYVQYKDDIYVKLRLIGYSFNPLLPSSSSLQIQFSNYVRSRSYYRDWDSLLGNNSGSGVSQYSGGGGGSGNDGAYGESDDIDVTISNTMLAKLLNTELFGTRVTDVILDTVDANAITARSATFGSLANGTTIIDGNCITTGYIRDLAYQNLVKNGTIANGSITNTTGSIIDLNNGFFNFAGGKMKWDGSTFSVSGNITANSGFIGKDASHAGWTIKSNAIYSGADSLVSNTTGTYIGTDGILNYNATTGTSVKITNGGIAANSGTIGGWMIGTSGISYTQNYTTDGTDGQNTYGMDAKRYIGLVVTNGRPLITTSDSGNGRGVTVGTGAITLSFENGGSTLYENKIYVYRSATAGGLTYSQLTPTTIYEDSTALSEKYAAKSHGYHVPTPQTANNAKFLRNDNTWQTVTPANIGAATSGHNHSGTYLKLSGGTIDGDLTVTGALIAHNYAGNNGRVVTSTGTSGGQVAGFRSDHASRFGVRGQWNTTSFSVKYITVGGDWSDIRLKENFKPVDWNAVDFINKINLYSFDWKGIEKHRGHQNIGIIADELEKLDSGLVSGGGEDEDGNIIPKDINTLYLSAYEIKAIQELSTQISELKSEIKQLKKQLQER